MKDALHQINLFYKNTQANILNEFNSSKPHNDYEKMVLKIKMKIKGFCCIFL